MLRQRDGVLRLIDYGGAETFFRGDGLDKARCDVVLLITHYSYDEYDYRRAKAQ